MISIKFMSKKDVAEKLGYFPEGGISHLMFSNTDNFRLRCCRKIGKKILINIDEMEKWIDEHVMKNDDRIEEDEEIEDIEIEKKFKKMSKK